jgi:hypothetical protein
MTLRRRKRKMKLLSTNGSVEHLMDDQGEDSTDSLESGIKQGNIRNAQRGFSEMKTELDRE